MSCRAATRPLISSGRVSHLVERRTAHFRAHERRHVQLDGALWHPGATEPIAVKVLNLGLAGAGIACKLGVRKEDRITLTLLSDSLLDPLPLPGRIAWVQASEGLGLLYSGIAFEIPDRTQLLTLFHLIAAVTA
jgi:hypothetical protein